MLLNSILFPPNNFISWIFEQHHNNSVSVWSILLFVTVVQHQFSHIWPLLSNMDQIGFTFYEYLSVVSPHFCIYLTFPSGLPHWADTLCTYNNCCCRCQKGSRPRDFRRIPVFIMRCHKFSVHRTPLADFKWFVSLFIFSVFLASFFL